MYDEDEDELELLRQYEGNQYDDNDDDAHSSDQIDSDLEDKIMSMVQYGTGLTKKSVPVTPSEAVDRAPSEESQESGETVEPEVVHGPVDLTKRKKANFSFSNELQLQNSDMELDSATNSVEESDSDESDDNDEKSLDAVAVKPQVTNYINLEQQPVYMDDEETSEEEAELNSKLQRLIEDQIYNRQKATKRLVNQTARICFSCHQPGHERRDCTLCMDCGGPKHSDGRCSGTRYCSKCKFRGHLFADCPNQKCFVSCRLCNMSYHNWCVCPSLLHVYTNEDAPKVIPTAYCYNCTENGHYGDDCPYLPSYLYEMKSVFSKLSLGRGSRFDPKKSLKESASSFGRQSSMNHQRWSDSSRESSPRRDYSNDKGKKRKYNHNQTNSEESYSRYDRGDHKRSKGYDNRDKKATKYKYTNTLDQYFSSDKNGKGGNSAPQRSGNSNWKALNNNSLPQPTRSGTVNVKNNSRSSNEYDGDFPRGRETPKPSSSGVIDLKDVSTSSRRGPKYHGGYKRNR